MVLLENYELTTGKVPGYPRVQWVGGMGYGIIEHVGAKDAVALRKPVINPGGKEIFTRCALVLI